MLFLLQENYLDALPLHDVRPFTAQFVSYVQSVYDELYNEILTTGDITEQQRQKLHDDCKRIYELYVPAKYLCILRKNQI